MARLAIAPMLSLCRTTANKTGTPKTRASLESVYIYSCSTDLRPPSPFIITEVSACSSPPSLCYDPPHFLLHNSMFPCQRSSTVTWGRWCEACPCADLSCLLQNRMDDEHPPYTHTPLNKDMHVQLLSQQLHLQAKSKTDLQSLQEYLAKFM